MMKLTHHNSSYTHLPISFDKGLYLDAITSWQHKLTTRIITESHVDLFFDTMLKAGLYLRDHPEIPIHRLHILVAGGIVSERYIMRYRPRCCYLEYVGTNKFVKLSRGYAGCYPVETYIDRIYTGDKIISLQDIPLDRSRLSLRYLPLYLNDPILGEYARKKLSDGA